MSSHERISGLLPEYLAGLLDDGTKARVAAHIAGCEECQEELSVLDALQGLGAPDPGERFWSENPKAVAALARAARRKRRTGFLLKAVLPLAAAAALLVAFVLHFPAGRRDVNVSQAFYTDPLSAEFAETDISGLDAGAERRMDAALDDELALRAGDEPGSSGTPDYISLSPEDLESLGKILNQYERRGGIRS